MKYLVINDEAWCESRWYSKICKQPDGELDWAKVEVTRRITCAYGDEEHTLMGLVKAVILYLDPKADVTFVGPDTHALLTSSYWEQINQ